MFKKKNLQKFSFKVTGIRSTLITGGFSEEDVMVEIWAENFRKAYDSVEEYFYKTYLRAEKIKCVKIEI